LNKWYRALAEDVFSENERVEILPLILWVRETLSGDISQNTGLRRGEDSAVWSRLCSDGSDCLGANCRYKERCFYQKIKAAAQGAHVVIANHALLFSDATMDHAVLDRYTHLIVDEAHGLEKVATQHFGYAVSLRLVKRFLSRLQSGDKAEFGLFPYLLRRIEKSTFSKDVKMRLSRRIRQISGTVHQASEAAATLFDAVREIAVPRQDSDRIANVFKWRYRGDDELMKCDSDHLRVELQKLTEGLSLIGEDLLNLSEGSVADHVELTQAVNGLAQECQAMSSHLLSLLAADDEKYVYWVECSVQNNEEIGLYTAPLDIGELLRSHLYEGLRTLVLTSGTLTVGGRFDYMMGRLGLDPDRTLQFVTDSPFNYPVQARVYVPSFLPSPKEPSFQGELGRLIREVVLATRRGTLVLFTSYDMLRSTYEGVRDSLEGEGITVLAQGVNGSRSRLMARFKEERPAVLMGTESFWEGVDVPGDMLEILVLTRLPFAVPTEPIVEAHMELCERRGHNSFFDFSLPEAVIKFRQGFGRLIRSRDDRGVAILCDTRLLTTQYGHLFLDSLPIRPTVCQDRKTLVKEVQQWLSTNTR
jgi:Rad3-related DNA helicase